MPQARLAGMLRVVDLAGSERREDVYEHTAARVTEMKDISWSLGCLKVGPCRRGGAPRAVVRAGC